MKHRSLAISIAVLAVPMTAAAATVAQGADGTQGSADQIRKDATTGKVRCSQSARGARINLPGSTNPDGGVPFDPCATVTLASTDIGHQTSQIAGVVVGDNTGKIDTSWMPENTTYADGIEDYYAIYTDPHNIGAGNLRTEHGYGNLRLSLPHVGGPNSWMYFDGNESETALGAHFINYAADAGSGAASGFTWYAGSFANNYLVLRKYNSYARNASIMQSHGGPIEFGVSATPGGAITRSLYLESETGNVGVKNAYPRATTALDVSGRGAMSNRQCAGPGISLTGVIATATATDTRTWSMTYTATATSTATSTTTYTVTNTLTATRTETTTKTTTSTGTATSSQCVYPIEEADVTISTSGVPSGSGTYPYVVKWNGTGTATATSTSQTASTILDDGTRVGVGAGATPAAVVSGGRSLNIIGTLGAMNISRISANIDSAAPTLEWKHFTTQGNAESNTTDYYWDAFIDSAGWKLRSRQGGDSTRLMIAPAFAAHVGKLWVSNQLETTAPAAYLSITDNTTKTPGGLLDLSWIESGSATEWGGVRFGIRQHNYPDQYMKGGLLYSNMSGYGRGRICLAVENTNDASNVDTGDCALSVSGLGASRTITADALAGHAGQFVKLSDANGVFTYGMPTAADVGAPDGTGTAQYAAMWSDSNTLTNFPLTYVNSDYVEMSGTGGFTLGYGATTKLALRTVGTWANKLAWWGDLMPADGGNIGSSGYPTGTIYNGTGTIANGHASGDVPIAYKGLVIYGDGDTPETLNNRIVAGNGIAKAVQGSAPDRQLKISTDMTRIGSIYGSANASQIVTNTTADWSDVVVLTRSFDVTWGFQATSSATVYSGGSQTCYMRILVDTSPLSPTEAAQWTPDDGKKYNMAVVSGTTGLSGEHDITLQLRGDSEGQCTIDAGRATLLLTIFAQ